jgi:Fe-S-cluster containining protein
LERQTERGNFFAHSALGENLLRLAEVESFLHGLIDTLLAKGLVNETDLVSAIDKVRSELMQRNELSGTRTVVRADDQAEAKTPVKVDCRTRLHICHAVCCKLDFALNIPEVESGKIKWDFGRPYFIRHDSHGSCVHLDPNSGCRIYNDRPGVCKQYSCAGDGRIWKDFEKMELNQEWIDANLSQPTGPRAIRALMHSPNCSSAQPQKDPADQGKQLYQR